MKLGQVNPKWFFDTLAHDLGFHADTEHEMWYDVSRTDIDDKKVIMTTDKTSREIWRQIVVAEFDEKSVS